MYLLRNSLKLSIVFLVTSKTTFIHYTQDEMLVDDDLNDLLNQLKIDLKKLTNPQILFDIMVDLDLDRVGSVAFPDFRAAFGKAGIHRTP